MTIGERINYLRKSHLNMTLDKFGEKIGLKKSTLSNIEGGRYDVTDQTVRSICREFHVDETWLRTGEGEMLSVQSRDAEIERFLNDVLNSGQDAFKRRLVAALSVLDEKDWEVLEKIVDSITREVTPDQPPGHTEGKSFEEMTPEEIAAEVARQRELEKEGSGRGSSVA